MGALASNFVVHDATAITALSPTTSSNSSSSCSNNSLQLCLNALSHSWLFSFRLHFNESDDWGFGHQSLPTWKILRSINPTTEAITSRLLLSRSRGSGISHRIQTQTAVLARSLPRPRQCWKCLVSTCTSRSKRCLSCQVLKWTWQKSPVFCWSSVSSR